jgi:DNA (cytosine-5)-methyltransferase 1
MKSNTLNVLDIFCGAGGFSEGFRQAGFNIVAGVDNDEQALQTYSHNFGHKKAILWNLADTGSLIKDPGKKNILRNIDVIIGGPPCQGFSIAGKRKASDPRNKLYKAYIDLIKYIRPKAIVIENVPTMKSLFEGSYFNQILSDLSKLGFELKSETLAAEKYGVPQKRRRLFIVGTLKGLRNFIFPAPVFERKQITCSEAISDLPLLTSNAGADQMPYPRAPKSLYQKQIRNGCQVLTNHWAVIHTEKTKKIIAMVPDGGNYKSLPDSLWETRKVNIAWTRMNSRTPCFTIDAGHNHHFHYKANRVPTVRECARIQSFPDHFSFVGNKTSQFRQVGNAVPPILANAIALSLMKVLFNEQR